MEKRFYSDVEISELTGISISKLRNDRSNNYGLPYCKFGRTVRYDIEDLIQWINNNKIYPAIIFPGKSAEHMDP